MDEPVIEADSSSEASLFDQLSWTARREEEEIASAGGRIVLGWALAVLALLWTGYSAWSAGRVLADQPLTSPAVAQWIAILTGPLALMGLIWLMFGRTRRKEAERFTRSVVAMHTEANALQDILAALSRQIEHNHTALGTMAGDLMGLGDQAATRLGAVTAELNAGSRTLADHGAALDRAAENARADIGVLLTDLPMAEESARRMAETLRAAGQSAITQAAGFEQQVDRLAAQTQQADTIVHDASQRLLGHLAQIERAGSAASERLNDAGNETGAMVDALLARAAEALSEVRGGIDAQAAAVSALVAQSQAGIGRAGIDASQLLGERLASAGAALDGLGARVAEHDRASQRMIADLDAGLSALDEHFFDLARAGDERAGHVQVALNRLRTELDTLATSTSAQDGTIEGLALRTATLREGVDQLGLALRGEMANALGSAEEGAARLLASAEAADPLVTRMRDTAVEAADRIEA
ncbi:MAG: hypothetical protein ACR2FK_05665, partial [Sphingomicrobium sp.]